MPSSPRPFQNDYIKDSKTENLFRKRKEMVLEKDISDKKRDQYILWNTFFRRNIPRFVEMVLQVKLFPYQIIWLFLMSKSDVFVSICARAASKSFLVAVFTVSKAILYPGSEILVAASTIKQASLILSSKVTQLRDMSPVLQREITNIVFGQNTNECTFANGSVIKIVAANEGSRGNRATTLLMDEYLLLKEPVVHGILLPFLYVRIAPFMLLDEYADYPQEEPQVISISSAGFKTDWGYKYAINVIKMFLEGKSAGFFAVDYLISIKSGIKTKAQIEAERRNSDPDTFSREYENLFSGESNKAYFKNAMFQRNIKKAFYPIRNDNYGKKNPYEIKIGEGELRILSVDLATRAGRTNDLSVFSLTRLLPTQRGFSRLVVYLESFSGANILTQTLRAKQLYHEFGCSYLVLDLQQAGIAMYDGLGVVTSDPERGLEYPAMTVMQHSSIDDKQYLDLSQRTLAINAIPTIYPIIGSAGLNSTIAIEMRDKLQKKMMNFLVSDADAEDFLIRSNNKEFLANGEGDLSLRSWFLHPHIQTNIFISQCVNLEMSLVSGNIKLTEGTGRKDHYTSVAYMNHFACLLDQELLKEGNTESDWDILQSVTMIL